MAPGGFERVVADAYEDMFGERPDSPGTLDLFDECLGDRQVFAELLNRIDVHLGDACQTNQSAFVFSERMTVQDVAASVLPCR